MLGITLGAFAKVNTILRNTPQPTAGGGNVERQNRGYASGGFTERAGDDMKPVGIVHANEYVINARQLRNPAVMDFARILEANRLKGFAQGGFTSSTPVSNVNNQTINNISGVNEEMAKRMLLTMERLEQRLREPIKTYTVVGNKEADEIKGLMMENQENRIDLSV
jgi:hypothetical protein